MIRAGVVLVLVASAGAAGAAGAVVVYRAGPPPAHTGAFGEPDCGECHFDAARNDREGSARILAPDSYQPGHSHTLTVELRRPALAAAGFQLSARYLHGPAAGEQAGTLESLDGRTAVEITEEGIMYASHTAAGAAPGPGNHAAHGDESGVAEHGVARWTLRWTAPADGGDVAFDLAAQVANDDDSEFGETLYTSRRVVQAAPAGKPKR